MFLDSLRTLFRDSTKYKDNVAAKADAPSSLPLAFSYVSSSHVTQFPSRVDVQMLAMEVLEIIFFHHYRPPLCLNERELASPVTRHALNAEVLRLTGMDLKEQPTVPEDSPIHLAAEQILATTRKAFGLETTDDSPWVRATARTMRRHAIAAFKAHCQTSMGPVLSPDYLAYTPLPTDDGSPATVIVDAPNIPARMPDMSR